MGFFCLKAGFLYCQTNDTDLDGYQLVFRNSVLIVIV